MSISGEIGTRKLAELRNLNLHPTLLATHSVMLQTCVPVSNSGMNIKKYVL